FATKSQEAVSLGSSPSSSINTKEPEKIKADAAMGTTAFPAVDSTRDTESDKERPSEMAGDDAQSTAIKYLVTVPKNVIDPTAGSVLGNLKVTVSVSTPGPVSSVFSEEWDDTRLESISRGRPPEPGDNAETQVRTEPPHRIYESFEATEESPTSTEVTKVAPGFPGGGTALVTTLGVERSPVLTHQISFTHTRLAEDPEVSTMKLFSSAGGFRASTQGDRTQLSSETAVSASQYEPLPQQAAGDVLKEGSQEMTVVIQEIDTTLPVVTQEHMATIEVPRGSGEPEESLPSTSPVSAEVGDAELSRRWESPATPASTTVGPLSLQLTSSMEGCVKVSGKSKELIDGLSLVILSCNSSSEAGGLP
ncbi:LOW QUALITY PROTEIN: armadillo-like helical domain-containing protein 4, partial [Mastomys coucha]|uniref:LOW QUALITY PROTEIN: armadillo-like helical domain-containing protein 4 n=1 Tax=Mastomys coucha TaxID=35658 RepID=UPI0012626CD1